MPLLGDEEFGISGYTAGLTFILVFGLATAVANYLAGTWGDRYGRKPVLVAGWLIAVAVPQRVGRPDAPSGPPLGGHRPPSTSPPDRLQHFSGRGCPDDHTASPVKIDTDELLPRVL